MFFINRVNDKTVCVLMQINRKIWVKRMHDILLTMAG